MGIFPRLQPPADPHPSVYRAETELAGLLPHLPSRARVVLRAAGIAVSSPMTGPDGSTGLTLTADSRLALHFFRCPIDDTLTAALSDETGATPLSLHFPGVPWVSPTTRNLVLRARAEPTTAPGIWSRGAGAWLDEGLHDRLQLQTETLYLLSVIDESRSIHVSASAAGCSVETSFRPTFIDLDGSLLRISDRHGRHAVHLHPGRVRAHQDHDQLRLHSIPT